VVRAAEKHRTRCTLKQGAGGWVRKMMTIEGRKKRTIFISQRELKHKNGIVKGRGGKRVQHFERKMEPTFQLLHVTTMMIKHLLLCLQSRGRQ
jgi:hypothetical protein